MHNDHLKAAKEAARQFYTHLGSVYCPYLNEQIGFNSEGFNHIQFKSSRRERHTKVQMLRYKLLFLAPKVLSKSNTLQEFQKLTLKTPIKINKTSDKVDKQIQFYGFIAILNGWKIKVIIRQIGDGKKHFWSIIPNWKTRKSQDGKIHQNHTGDLFND